jgi:signal transduction histidine kinase
VARFALTTLLVFALVGVAITYLRARDVRAREEQAAQSRAELIASEVLAPALTPGRVSRPMEGDRYARIDAIVKQAITSDPGIKRVKIWGTDGTVLYSNDPNQVGQHLEMEDDLKEAFDGEVSSDISDLSKPENADERPLADKLFETYVPIRVTPEGPTDTGSVNAVVEVYRDYHTIQAEIDRLTRTLGVSLVAGLLVLYILLLPVMVGTTRKLRRQNEQLKEQAGKMSELLEREQETVAELRELDRMKGDFVAAASHELRSPLTSIRGYANLLRNAAPADDPIAEEAIDAIERQTSRMLRLVMNLLRESRIEADAAPPAVFAFDMPSLVREVTADFHLDGERIRSEVAEDLPDVRCDRGRVSDVLVNLVDNALKYAAQDTPVVIGAQVADGALTLRVSDQGPGIDPGDVIRVFDRFYQADQSATRAHGGVGLGLHIVKGLVESLDGRVWVDSVPGAGSTFWVRIPLVSEDAPVREPSVRA